MTTTFIDSGQTLEDFAETIYVRCPVGGVIAKTDHYLSRSPFPTYRITQKLFAS
jgi:hypothetical protein